MMIKYTSEIAPEKTIAEITKCLARHGASAIMTDYDKGTGKVTGLAFKMLLGDKSLNFRLPYEWQSVYVILTSGLKFNSRDEERNVQRKKRYREQAERTSWRIVKEWVDAQMALVEAKMITAPQVFLPYAVMRDGKTLSETIAQNPQLLIDADNSHESRD